MNMKFTKLIGLAIFTGLFTTSLIAQTTTKTVVEVKSMQIKNIELRSVDNKAQLRADNKAWPEYTIDYTPSGEMSSKSVYKYDAVGNVVLRTDYKLESDAWENSRKYIFEYDTNGNQILYEWAEWKGNAWVNVSKNVYEYDEAGNQTLFENAKWENNAWINESKYIYEYGKDGLRDIQYEYTWDGKDWILENESAYFNANLKVCYFIEDNEITFGYPMGDGSWASFHTYSMEGNATYTTKNDTNDNLILFEHKDVNGNGYTYNITYNTNNKPTLIERSYNNGVVDFKAEYEYDKNGNCTGFENFYGDGTTWGLGSSKHVMVYNTHGQRILFERYARDWENNIWALEQKDEWIYEYDSADRMISYERHDSYGNYKYRYKYDNKENQYITYYYDLVNNKWKLRSYRISYPNDDIPEAEVSNNEPIDNNNQGGFDIDVNIPTDSISNGNITITLPEGFTLDEKNTTLTLDFAGLFELKITKQENNSWLIEINPKSIKSAALTSESATKMLHVAYKVDETLVKGTYDISINNILFETPGGNLIPEPAITVPANVTRWGVDNEQMNVSEPTVYVSNHILYVQTLHNEKVYIYSITGAKLYETQTQSGTTAINATFPKGVLFVKGSSGWAKKVLLH